MPLHPFAALASLLLASTMLSLLGLLAALWAEKFDQMAAVTNFVVTPMSFLSGTFYSIHDLPGAFHALALANPFFYMIDGIRWSFTGHADGPVALGYIVIVLVTAGLWTLTWLLVKSGYRLKDPDRLKSHPRRQLHHRPVLVQRGLRAARTPRRWPA